jgi:excisionase family DNA binding protein
MAREHPYTVDELAERWSCTREAIYAAIRHPVNPLPAFKIGGKLWRIRAEEVTRWENAGGSTRSEGTGSEPSEPQTDDMRPSSAGETRTDPIDADLVSSARQRVERRLMHSLAGSKL